MDRQLAIETLEGICKWYHGISNELVVGEKQMEAFEMAIADMRKMQYLRADLARFVKPIAAMAVEFGVACLRITERRTHDLQWPSCIYCDKRVSEKKASQEAHKQEVAKEIRVLRIKSHAAQPSNYDGQRCYLDDKKDF